MTWPSHDNDDLTELVDGQFDRVDLVGKAANGTRFLIAKSADEGHAGMLSAAEVRALVAKADGDLSGRPTRELALMAVNGSGADRAAALREIGLRSMTGEPPPPPPVSATPRAPAAPKPKPGGGPATHVQGTAPDGSEAAAVQDLQPSAPADAGESADGVRKAARQNLDAVRKALLDGTLSPAGAALSAIRIQRDAANRLGTIHSRRRR